MTPLTGGLLERGIISTTLTRELRAALMSLHDVTGLHLSLMDLASGTLIASSGRLELCERVEHGVPCMSVGCIASVFGSLGRDSLLPVKGACDLGLPFVAAPVVRDGQVVCHVLVTGFLGTKRERDHVRRLVRQAGVDEDEAARLMAGIADLGADQAKGLALLAASHAGLLLSQDPRREEPTTKRQEMRLLGMASELAADISAYERVPQRALEIVLRFSGGAGGLIVLTSEASGDLEVVAESGECEVFSDRWLGIVRHVMEARRSSLITGIDAHGPGEQHSTLVVPLALEGAPAGALLVSRHDPTGMSADEIRLVEVFGESVSGMLDNAREFRDINARLLELIQVGEVSRALNATLDYDRLAELALQVLSKSLGFDAGGFVVEGFGATRAHVVHLVDLHEGDLTALIDEVSDPPAGYVRLAAPCTHSSMCRLLEGSGRSVADWSVLSGDLVFHNVRAGTLFAASSVPGRFSAQDERILAAVAAHLSISLENSALYEQLSADFRRTISAITALADANERMGRGHTDRVMDYAVATAHEMGLMPERVNLVRFAGLLHDVGKTGVAEEILIKPSSLTADEMEQVRRHSELGASIVEQIRVLEDLTPVIRHHHEHFDGSGYPAGLAGSQIPLEARIVAVADAFEAMTGRRAHRKRMPFGAARAELEASSGTQFDPEVVAAFLRILERRAEAGATGAYAPRPEEDGQEHLPA